MTAYILEKELAEAVMELLPAARFRLMELAPGMSPEAFVGEDDRLERYEALARKTGWPYEQPAPGLAA